MQNIRDKVQVWEVILILLFVIPSNIECIFWELESWFARNFNYCVFFVRLFVCLYWLHFQHLEMYWIEPKWGHWRLWMFNFFYIFRNQTNKKSWERESKKKRAVLKVIWTQSLKCFCPLKCFYIHATYTAIENPIQRSHHHL